MRFDPQQLRIDGVYAQRQPGTFMLRIKVPAGILSAEQAEAVADIADRFAGGLLHLTTRGSIELHGLTEDHLPSVWRGLAAVGLTTRGACGGAVRGVVCGSVTAAAWPWFSRWPTSSICTLPAIPISRRCLKNSRSAFLPATTKGVT